MGKKPARLALHSAQLSFKGLHGEAYNLEAPLQKDLRATINQLGKQVKKWVNILKYSIRQVHLLAPTSFFFCPSRAGFLPMCLLLKIILLYAIVENESDELKGKLYAIME